MFADKKFTSTDPEIVSDIVRRLNDDELVMDTIPYAIEIIEELSAALEIAKREIKQLKERLSDRVTTIHYRMCECGQNNPDYVDICNCGKRMK